MNHMNDIKYIENTINIFVPMTIKRRGGGHATVILPKDALKEAPEVGKPNYDYRLINGFAKAYKWQQAMLKKPKLTINDLAKSENLTAAYVGRILRLNLLAPDIIKTIIEGRQPRNLKLQDFMVKAMPNLWQEQREIFGFI